MTTHKNAASAEINLTPDEIRRMRVALVDYVEKALSSSGEVDGQIFPAAVELLTYLLESTSRLS